MQLISICIVICIVICQVLEVYAYFLKGMTNDKYSRQLVGLANWIQYVARINYVIVLFLISYSFEVLDMGTRALQLITFSFFISFITSTSLIIFKKPRVLLHYLLTPLIYFAYKELIKVSVDLDKKQITFNKSMVISFIASLLLGFAFVLPFILAERFPEYRMMATYSGQFLNFFASAIIFSMLEPIMYKELDTKSVPGIICESATGVIISKTFAQLFLAILIFILI